MSLRLGSPCPAHHAATPSRGPYTVVPGGPAGLRASGEGRDGEKAEANSCCLSGNVPEAAATPGRNVVSYRVRCRGREAGLSAAGIAGKSQAKVQ